MYARVLSLIAAIFTLSAFAPAQAQSADTEESEVLGQFTRSSRTLMGDRVGALYALQVTPRGGHACQVRAFYRGEAPKTARFCRGRVLGRYVARSGVTQLGVGEVLTGLSLCTTERRGGRAGVVARIRLHSSEGGEPAELALQECANAYEAAHCETGWAVQGVEFFFDGDPSRFSHRDLIGLRPLCGRLPARY